MALFFSRLSLLGQVIFLSSVLGQGIPDEGTRTQLELSQGTVQGYIEPSLGIMVVQFFYAFRTSFKNGWTYFNFKLNNHGKVLNGIPVFRTLIHRSEIGDGKHR